MSAYSDATVESVTLGRLLEVVGETLLEPLTLPRGLATPVRDVSVHDPAGPAPQPGHILLAVGAEPTTAATLDLARGCGTLDAAALVVKHRQGSLEPLRDAAAHAGVAILLTPPEGDWAHLVVTLRAALVSAGMPPAGMLSAVPLGDLFTLANTVADMVGGPVTIEDPHSRVLAFSHTNDIADEPRRLSILGQQVPSNWISDLRERGIFSQLWSSPDPVAVPSLPEHGLSGRLAIAVRSGQEILGSIWVAPGERPLPEHAGQALTEAARVAAVHLLSYAHHTEASEDATSRAVRAFLDGRTSAAVLAAELGIRDHAATLIAVAPRDPPDPFDAARCGTRLANLALTHCRARGLPAGGTVVDGHALLVLGVPAAAPPRLRALLADLAARASAALRLDVVAAGGQTVPRLEDLPAQRTVVDGVLHVLRHRARDLPAATPDDVHVLMLLSEVTRLLEERPELRTGPVHQLARLDAEQGTDYLFTLSALLAAFGEVRAAAERVRVHPNTFRYRIRRIVDLTGLNLDDPDERVAAALQLLYLQAQRPTS